MSMGFYDEDALAEILLQDLREGHEWNCMILENVSDGGGYCNCGKFVRGVSPFDPLNDKKHKYDKPSRKQRLLEWLRL